MRYVSGVVVLCVLSAVACRAVEPVDASAGVTMGAAHFEINEDSNTLIVTTDPDTNETIQRLIAELDRPVPQVLIKVLFLEVTHTDDLDVGTDMRFEHSESDGDQSVLATMFGAAGFTQGGTVAILQNDLEVTLSVLAEVTETEVLSRPSIMTRNNQEATITIGSEVPFIRNSQVTDDGRVLNTVEYEDVGIILTVTPQIADDNTVELDVAPEISTLGAESVTISEGVEAPTFTKRSAETRVVVPDGRTIVIGGLMDDQDVDTVRKVPILGDIPVLGNLFRRRIRDQSKTELLIFLTPHVVRGGDEGLALTNEEQNDTSLMPSAFQRDSARRLLPSGAAVSPARPGDLSPAEEAE